MKKLINKLLKSAQQFSVYDYAVFKICLISFGILIGAYFNELLLANISWIWIIAGVTWIIMIYRIFSNYEK